MNPNLSCTARASAPLHLASCWSWCEFWDWQRWYSAKSNFHLMKKMQIYVYMLAIRISELKSSYIFIPLSPLSVFEVLSTKKAPQKKTWVIRASEDPRSWASFFSEDCLTQHGSQLTHKQKVQAVSPCQISWAFATKGVCRGSTSYPLSAFLVSQSFFSGRAFGQGSKYVTSNG